MANPLAAEIWALRPWTLDLSSLDRDRPLSLLAGYRGLAGDRGLNFLCSTAQATADLQAMEEEVDRGSSGLILQTHPRTRLRPRSVRAQRRPWVPLLLGAGHP